MEKKQTKAGYNVYEFYVTDTPIFWTVNSPDKPSREYFNKHIEPTFILIDQCYLSFVSKFTIKTILPKSIQGNSATILKVYDSENNTNRYFLLNKTTKETKGMYEYEGILDAWLTYGLDFIEWAKTQHIPIKVNRFLNNRLMRQYCYEHHYEKADPLFDFSKESYALALSPNFSISSGLGFDNFYHYLGMNGDQNFTSTSVEEYSGLDNMMIVKNDVESYGWRVYVFEVTGTTNESIPEYMLFILPRVNTTVTFYGQKGASGYQRNQLSLAPWNLFERWYKKTALGTKLRGIYNIPFFKNIGYAPIKGLCVYEFAEPDVAVGTDKNALCIRLPITDALQSDIANAANKNTSFFPMGYAYNYPEGVRSLNHFWYVRLTTDGVYNHVGVVAPKSVNPETPPWFFTIPYIPKLTRIDTRVRDDGTAPLPIHPYLISRISYNGSYLSPEARLTRDYIAGQYPDNSWNFNHRLNKRPTGLWYKGMISYDGLHFIISNSGVFSQANLFQSNGTMIAPIDKYNEYLQGSRSQMNAQLQIAKENSDLQRTKAISESVTSGVSNIGKGIGAVLSGNWGGLVSAIAGTASSISNGVTGVQEAENVYKHRELQIEAQKADQARLAKSEIISSNYTLDDFEQKYKEFIQSKMVVNGCGISPLFSETDERNVNKPAWGVGAAAINNRKQYEDSMLIKAPFDTTSAKFYTSMFWKVGVYADFYSDSAWVFGNDDNTPYGYRYYTLEDSYTQDKVEVDFTNYFTYLNLEIDENVYRKFKGRATLEEMESIKTIFGSGVRIWYDLPTFQDDNPTEGRTRMNYTLIPFNVGIRDQKKVLTNSVTFPFQPYIDSYHGVPISSNTKEVSECSSVENDLTKSMKNTKKRSSK